MVLHIATSQDGFIAASDHGLDWLPAPGQEEDYGLGAFIDEVDAVVMGRITWDVVSGFDEEPFPGKEVVIMSRATGDAAQIISEMKQQQGGTIWLLGGGILNGHCFQAGLIDEIVITVIPTKLTTGITLWGEESVDLSKDWFMEKTTYPDGVCQEKWLPKTANSN